MKFLNEVKRVFSPYLKGDVLKTKESSRKFLEGIESCIKERNFRDALAIAKRGIELFPEQKELNRALLHLEKEQQRRELRSILARLQKNPNPVLYSRAADLYIALGQMGQALRVAEDAMKKFPEKEDPYLILGKIRWERFRKDLLAKDGREALENLKKAIQRNPENLHACTLLGEIHLAVGAPDIALKYFFKVRIEGPNWEQLDRWIDAAKKLPDTGEDIDALLKKVEDGKCFPMPFWERESSERNVQSQKSEDKCFSIEKTVEALESFEGVLHAFTVSHNQDDEVCSGDAHPLAKGVAEISKYAEIAARRMDLGNLQDGTIEGPFGTLAFRAVEGGLIALIGEKSLKDVQALALLKEGEDKGRA